MSGHNKWSKIKHKKGVTDARKSREFSKFARLITMEVKKVNGDESAPNVKKAVQRAKQANTPTDNIERATKRGKEKDTALLEEVIYEAYGVGASALIIYGLTYNKNRTSSEIKHILTKNGSSLADRGAAAWAFEKKDGVWEPKTTIPLSHKDKEKLSKLIDELKENEDVQDVYTNAT